VLFVGAYERQLDDKGRLALPAPFRAHLGEQCYLAKGLDKCIDVIPVADFERVATEMMEAVKRGEVSLQRQRSLAFSAVLVNVDKQGRVKLDDTLRAYAEIDDDTMPMVAGNLDRLEIWSPERYRRVNAVGDDQLAGSDLDGSAPDGQR
jgi:MraZ protein